MKGTKSLLAGLACGLAACAHPLELRVSSTDLPADGLSTREISARGGKRPVRIEVVEGAELVTELRAEPARLILRAGLRPGRVTLSATDGKDSARLTLALHADRGDRDADGFPDVAEISASDERALFAARFVAAARSQIAETDPRWEEAQRDCAGLVRFAFRQALRGDPSLSIERQAGRLGFSSWGSLPIVYPEIPFLGDAPFRIQPGAFDPAASGAFSYFADGKHLLLFNTVFLGRDSHLARPGDLLFFFHPENREQPYHAMIFFRVEGRPYVVYHTGALGESEERAGRLKEISLSRLGRHPDSSWQPRPSNESFLGYYRFKILS
jgi:uncharacterized protein YfaT (DUF1175 family)